MKVLRNFLDCLFRWVEAETSEDYSSDTLSVAMPCSKQISTILQTSNMLLSQFEVYMANTLTQENIINVLQFLAIEAIFLDIQHENMESIVSKKGLENLKVVSMEIVSQVAF